MKIFYDHYIKLAIFLNYFNNKLEEIFAGYSFMNQDVLNYNCFHNKKENLCNNLSKQLFLYEKI